MGSLTAVGGRIIRICVVAVRDAYLKMNVRLGLKGLCKTKKYLIAPEYRTSLAAGKSGFLTRWRP
jgi:hypothetical protein